MFLNIVSHCNIKPFRTASLKHASSSELGSSALQAGLCQTPPQAEATDITSDSGSHYWQ